MIVELHLRDQHHFFLFFFLFFPPAVPGSSSPAAPPAGMPARPASPASWAALVKGDSPAAKGCVKAGFRPVRCCCSWACCINACPYCARFLCSTISRKPALSKLPALRRWCYPATCPSPSLLRYCSNRCLFTSSSFSFSVSFALLSPMDLPPAPIFSIFFWRSFWTESVRN